MTIQDRSSNETHLRIRYRFSSQLYYCIKFYHGASAIALPRHNGASLSSPLGSPQDLAFSVMSQWRLTVICTPIIIGREHCITFVISNYQPYTTIFSEIGCGMQFIRISSKGRCLFTNLFHNAYSVFTFGLMMKSADPLKRTNCTKQVNYNGLVIVVISQNFFMNDTNGY